MSPGCGCGGRFPLQLRACPASRAVLLRNESGCACSVPLPAGAIAADEWRPDGYRVFEGEERHIGESITVWTHGIRHDDGHIDDGTTEAPGISVDGVFWDTAISSDTARRLADLLVMAADEIDGWA